MNTRHGWTLTVLCIGALITPGCSQSFWTHAGAAGAGAAVGVGTALYVKGDLEEDLDHEIDDVYKATVSSIKDRGWTIEKDSLGETQANVEGSMTTTDGEQKNYNINMEQNGTGGPTHISIRVGIIGDETASRQIMQDIRARL